MVENRLHVGVIRVISIISVILVVIGSNNFYNSSQGYPLQTSTNTSKLHSQSVTNSTNNKTMIDTRALVFNQSKQNDEGKMSTGELGPPSNGIPANVERYIDQLSKSSPSQIASFPINDLPSETLIDVLKGLSAQNLYKVLNSISVDNLSTLLQSIGPDQTEILNKLSPNQKMDIQSRATS